MTLFFLAQVKLDVCRYIMTTENVDLSRRPPIFSARRLKFTFVSNPKIGGHLDKSTFLGVHYFYSYR